MSASNLSQPRQIYGIHSFSAVNRTTSLPYGKLIKVLGSANLSHTRELNTLTGGSNPNAVAVEPGVATNEISLNIKEYETWLHELAGADVTNNAAEASGSASALENKVGTSVFDATTGVATAGVKSGSEDDVKDGIYMVVAVSTTTVDVYNVTDISFTRGTDLSYVDDSLKVTSSALTITTSTAVEIPNTGIEITGGSGTIGMTVDDVAFFTVRSKNTRSSIITYGENPQPVEFRGYFYTQKSVNGDYVLLEAPRCIFTDFPMGATENEFSTTDITIQVLFDSTECITHKIHDVRG